MYTCTIKGSIKNLNCSFLYKSFLSQSNEQMKKYEKKMESQMAVANESDTQIMQMMTGGDFFAWLM